MSPLAFRNVDVSPDEPVSNWPLEAIQTALERGGLSQWRRLATAVRAQPWGPVARQIEEVLSYDRPYGVAELMERVIADARKRVVTAERAAVAAEVAELVESSGLSRAEFAAMVGTSPSRLSTYITGKVTPSAALMLRMSRLGAGLALLALPPPPATDQSRTRRIR
jgi:DNA-binding transcriptional regulator YiaG